MPIFQFLKDDITKGEFNPKADEKKLEKKENTNGDDKTSPEDCEPILNVSQTSEEFTYITPDSQRSSDGCTDSEHSFYIPETTVDSALKDYKLNKKEAKDDKDDDMDDNINDDDDEDNDQDDRDYEDRGENQEHEDHGDVVQVETNFEIKSIMGAVHKLSKESNERKTITFLDFAGQDIYYAFHQIYFSPESFSILVVDMRKDPKHTCENDDICCSRFNSWTYKGNKMKTNHLHVINLRYVDPSSTMKLS